MEGETRLGETGELVVSSRAPVRPNIRLAKYSIFRAETAFISVHPGVDITNSWCDIFYSEDNSTWLSLPVRSVDDHFEADFHTSHSSSAGTYYFMGEVGNKTGGASEKTGVLEITVKNNPPTAFIYINPEKIVVGYENVFDASGSFDLDGNITDFFWDFGDNSNESGAKVVHTYSTAGNYNASLTVIDNEGGKTTVTTPIDVDGNLLGINRGVVYTFGEERTVITGDQVNGNMKVEGNVDILVYETTVRGLGTSKMFLRKIGSNSFIDRIETETWEENDPDTGNVTTYWRCSFDSTELDDGEYIFGIETTEMFLETVLEVDNEPPFWSFFIIGLCLFVLTALVGLLIEWLRRRKLRKILTDIGYESKDVFRYVPMVSLTMFFTSIYLFISQFIFIINILNHWLYCVLLIFGIAISALFAHLSFTRKSIVITIIAALLCCGTGGTNKFPSDLAVFKSPCRW